MASSTTSVLSIRVPNWLKNWLMGSNRLFVMRQLMFGYYIASQPLGETNPNSVLGKKISKAAKAIGDLLVLADFDSSEEPHTDLNKN